MGKKITREELQLTADLLQKYDGVQKDVAKAMNVVPSVISDRKKRIDALGIEPNINSPIVPADLPDGDIPIEEVVENLSARFEKRMARYEAEKWREFKVHDEGPIGICWFGDPHLDDNGCNWPLLKKDVEVCKNTKGMYGGNIGDVHNNWVGRLTAEYAHQDTSVDTAERLIEWFFEDSGVDWMIMLLGNHDVWNDGSRWLKRLCANICPMVDWRAQFKLVFPNGIACNIDAAHDHKGHSQWNELHGQDKAAKMDGRAHLYVAGHRHNWDIKEIENPHNNKVHVLVRTRGYKYIDDYADRLGFPNQNEGASIVTIIDPHANSLAAFVKAFADTEEAADYLTFKRRKRGLDA